MKKFLFPLLALLASFAANALDVKDVENVHVKNRSRYVTDMASALSPQALAQADAMLDSVWTATSAEPVVVIVPSLDGEDIDDFATRLFEEWGIGKRDKSNGVLVLISTGDRKAVIRTGYGAEGVLPDVIASNIIRHDMAPHFREGDYDGGVLASVATIRRVMTDPEARQELMSEYENNAGTDFDGEAIWSYYVRFSAIAAAALLVLVLIFYLDSLKLPESRRYERLDKVRLGALIGTFLTLGMALPAWIIVTLMMRHVRLHKRLCPNCHTRMARVDEDNDNYYLSPGQDAEERLDSVDYDVWLCPSCGETDIIPYVNPRKSYTECPACHNRTAILTARRTILQPTTRREGQGIEEHTCLNCHHSWRIPYTIPKTAEPPIIILPGGGSGGGGGFSGGSFGGGFTGGGGASGSW